MLKVGDYVKSINISNPEIYGIIQNIERENDNDEHLTITINIHQFVESNRHFGMITKIWTFWDYQLEKITEQEYAEWWRSKYKVDWSNPLLDARY